MIASLQDRDRFRMCPVGDERWIVKERVRILWLFTAWWTHREYDTGGSWPRRFNSLVEAHEYILETIARERRVSAHKARGCIGVIEGDA